MATLVFSFSTLPDTELLAEVTRLAAGERRATVALIESLAEVDARRLYLGQGFASTFSYGTQVLHLSEHAAYNRIEAARAVRRFPAILERLADGSITLTTVCLPAAHLTTENHRDMLDAARHKSKRDVEVLVARLRPLPPVPSSVRKLPALSVAPRPTASPESVRVPDASPEHARSRDASSESARAHDTVTPAIDAVTPAVALALPAANTTSAGPALHAPRRAVVSPLSPEQYKVQLTVGRETVEKLRHTIPNGDPAAIVDRALTVLLAGIERTKLAATARPRPRADVSLDSRRASADAPPRSRHVPAHVRRAVWARDGHQCAFVSASGRRCQERGFLELHHTTPYAAGGKATIATIELRCRAHNLYEAELDFGPSTHPRRADADPHPATSR